MNLQLRKVHEKSQNELSFDTEPQAPGKNLMTNPKTLNPSGLQHPLTKVRRDCTSSISMNVYTKKLITT